MIVAAHGIPYVATASVAYLKDLQKKVKKAMEFQGPRYIQIDYHLSIGLGFPLGPDPGGGPAGCGFGLTPLFEMEDGKITHVRKIKKKIPVEEYLKSQKRFRHLFSGKGAEEEIKAIQALADENIEKYGLLSQMNEKDQED